MRAWIGWNLGVGEMLLAYMYILITGEGGFSPILCVEERRNGNGNGKLDIKSSSHMSYININYIRGKSYIHTYIPTYLPTQTDTYY